MRIRLLEYFYPWVSHTNLKLQVVKEIFNIFINRTIAYNYVHHIGLVTFDSDAQVSQPITPVIEDLRSAVLNIESHGLTALWKALLIAETQLSAYSHKYPSAKKRILALSDGENNIEPFSAQEICLTLQVFPRNKELTDVQKENIVVDSFVLGDAENKELKAISYAYIFIENVTQLLAPGDINSPPKISTVLSRFVNLRLCCVWKNGPNFSQNKLPKDHSQRRQKCTIPSI